MSSSPRIETLPGAEVDLPREVAEKRLAGVRSLDRFEQEKAAFHTRVRDEYLRLAAFEPTRFHVIDAGLSQKDIKVILEKIIITL